MANITFLEQAEPVDEPGRAMYAVARSILRAMLDELTAENLADLRTDHAEVTLRQLAYFSRLQRDKGMRGDGFEWAVHEAIQGREPRVTDLVAAVVKKASPRMGFGTPTSVLFGHERSRHLGFLDAVIDNAGDDAVLLPDGQGHPFAFGTWVRVAAEGQVAEPRLSDRIKQVWKTDIFLSNDERQRYLATTIKSNWRLLEGGRGLRIAIVPEAPDLRAGIVRLNDMGLYAAVLPDPNGFMGIFNDAYGAVAEAICTLGRHERGQYWAKPSALAQRIQLQLEKYGTARVVDIIDSLNEAAQQNLVNVAHQLVSVAAPPWLHITERSPVIIAPKPRFERL